MKHYKLPQAEGKTIKRISMRPMVMFIYFTDGTLVSIAWNGTRLNPMYVNEEGLLEQNLEPED